MQSERAPGMVVEGWTDRPTVPPDLTPVWNSYCELVGCCHAGMQLDLASIAEWVDRRHWRESQCGRALLFATFVELVKDRRRALAETDPPKEPEGD